jgi:hypothetical protein
MNGDPEVLKKPTKNPTKKQKYSTSDYSATWGLTAAMNRPPAEQWDAGAERTQSVTAREQSAAHLTQTEG